MSKHVILECLNLMEWDGDIGGFLRKVWRNGATGIRFFAICCWDGRRGFVPFKQVGEWEARADGVKYPMYDLSQWNDAYFDKLGEICYYLQHYGLSAWISLHDTCSWKYPEWKYNYPFFSCIQKFPGWTKESKVPGGSFGGNGTEIFKWHRNYYKQMVEFMMTFDIETYYEIMNEYLLDREKPENNIPFHRDSAKYLREIGVGMSHIVTSTIGPEDTWAYDWIWRELWSHVGMHSVHGVVTPEHVDDVNHRYVEVCGKDPRTILLSGDGGYGGTGDWDKLGLKRGLGTDQAQEVMRLVYYYNFAGYSYIPRNIKGREPENYDEANLAPLFELAAVAGTIPQTKIEVMVCSASGLLPTVKCPLVVPEWFEPGDEPREVCQLHCPDEIITPPKQKPCSYWLKRLNFKRWLKCVLKRN